MIVFAGKEMVPDLKSIWKECFGDSDSYIDLYFNKRFREDNMLVYLLEAEGMKTPISMLSMLPAKLVLKGREQKVRYLYAVATKPEYQGRGYSTKLLDYAIKFLKKQKEVAVLVPAKKSLFDFYGKRGFVKAFHLLEVVQEVKWVTGNDELLITDQVKILDITPKEYKVLRDACFYEEGYICWEEEAIAYVIEEALHEGGDCKKIIYNGNEYGVIFDMNFSNDTLYIKEITAVSKEAEELMQILARHYGCRYVHARLKVMKQGEGSFELAMISEEITLSAKILSTKVGSSFGYFNLTLG